jgi:hypothetical protein
VSYVSEMSYSEGVRDIIEEFTGERVEAPGE